MKLGTTIWRGLTVLSIGSIMLLGVACSGDDKSADSGNLVTGGSGKTLSECEYATAFLSKLTTLGTSMATMSGISSQGNPTAAFDELDKQLQTVTTEMKALKSTKDVNELNASLVAAIEGIRGQIPEAKKAANAGDIAKMEATMEKAVDDFGAKMDKMSKDHTKVSERLDKCGS